MKKTLLLTGILGMLLLAGTVSAKPERDISARRHPNLDSAQKFIDQAFERITAAQRANEFDMDGHAQKAKELLTQASAEVKMAAEAANHKERR